MYQNPENFENPLAVPEYTLNRREKETSPRDMLPLTSDSEYAKSSRNKRRGKDDGKSRNRDKPWLDRD